MAVFYPNDQAGQRQPYYSTWILSTITLKHGYPQKQHVPIDQRPLV